MEADGGILLRAWLLAVTGVPEIIFAHQDGDRPALPYGLLNLTGQGPIRRPSEHEYTSDVPENNMGTEIPVMEWRWNWSFNIFGGVETQSAMRGVIVAKESATTLESLSPYVIFGTSDVRDLTEIVDNRHEPRAQIDIDLRAELRDGVSINVIEDATTSFPDGAVNVVVTQA